MHAIQLNGEKRLVKASSVLDLLQELGLSPTLVLVEQNGLALLKQELEQAALASGDCIEILYIVAGG